MSIAENLIAWLIVHWDWWVIFGFAGQALFGMRFIYQWIVSERAGKSVIPESFWYLSLTGGGTTLIYAIHKQDPVFIFGQAAAMLVYLRNIHFIRRDKAVAAPAE
ncbi:MAG: lipid-A-disaccharide synthase N-terminal domain-containing protein [Alphaproteobacteria bacterium]